MTELTADRVLSEEPVSDALLINYYLNVHVEKLLTERVEPGCVSGGLWLMLACLLAGASRIAYLLTCCLCAGVRHGGWRRNFSHRNFWKNFGHFTGSFQTLYFIIWVETVTGWGHFNFSRLQNSLPNFIHISANTLSSIYDRKLTRVTLLHVTITVCCNVIFLKIIVFLPLLCRDRPETGEEE